MSATFLKTTITVVLCLFSLMYLNAECVLSCVWFVVIIIVDLFSKEFFIMLIFDNYLCLQSLCLVEGLRWVVEHLP